MQQHRGHDIANLLVGGCVQLPNVFEDYYNRETWLRTRWTSTPPIDILYYTVCSAGWMVVAARWGDRGCGRGWCARVVPVGAGRTLSSHAIATGTSPPLRASPTAQYRATCRAQGAAAEANGSQPSGPKYGGIPAASGMRQGRGLIHTVSADARSGKRRADTGWRLWGCG